MRRRHLFRPQDGAAVRGKQHLYAHPSSHAYDPAVWTRWPERRCGAQFEPGCTEDATRRVLRRTGDGYLSLLLCADHVTRHDVVTHRYRRHGMFPRQIFDEAGAA